MALINTLTSAVSALDSFTTGMNTIGNDIANVNTTAYKSSSVSFADTFNGVGVQVSGVNTDYSQGSLVSTGTTTDLGISGNGYFIVEDTATSTQYATRDGEFHFDSSGYLVNSEGYKVMGLTGGTSGSMPSTLGPIAEGTPPTGTTLESVSIGTTGDVVETYSDGTQVTTNQVLLQNFTDPSALSSVGNNLYSNIAAAGPLATTMASATNTAGSNGLGTIQSGTIEQSNVDLTKEFSDIITMQRAFEANSRVLTTSNTVLQDIVQMING